MKRKRKSGTRSKAWIEKENILPIAAVLLVLFAAMIDPIISFALAAAMIIVFLLYKVVSQEN